MSLYQRARPTSFAEVVGNQETVKSLASLTSQEYPPHAFLLIGPSGCGKTTLARIIASSLGVSSEDYRELDNAHFRGIDTIREIRDGAGYVGLHGTRRCWLLDEVHGLPKLSQEALLKGLEDPPSHAYFVLCTTAPESLLETIKGRCSIHKVSALSETDMIHLLYRVASSEGVRLPRQQLRLIYEKTDGKPRAALQLLEKVLAVDPESRDAVVAAAEAVKEKANNLARELMRRTGWKAIATILSQIDEDDVEATRRGIISYCSSILLREENDLAMCVLDQMVEPFYTSGKAGFIHACYSIIKA